MDWRLIWRTEVPQKVRVFWWRVIHEFLPARHILHRRHIEHIANCETCGAEESIKHVLLDCTVAGFFWNTVREVTGIKVPMLHENTWARELLYDEVCTRQDAAVIMCGMWSLWMMRDSRKHGEKPIPVRTAVQWVWETSYELWHLLHLERRKGDRS